jgi:hypothetical protein
MTAVRTRVLSSALVAVVALAACGDAAVDTTGLRGVALEDEESTTTTTSADTTTTTTTIPSEPCDPPQPRPAGWDGDLLAIHAAVTDLAAKGATLDGAIRGVTDFGPGWAEPAPVGGALYAFQVGRFDLMSDLEAMFRGAGATFIDGWSFPGDTTLAPLANAWEMALLDDFRTASLSALLAASNSAEVTALLDAGAVCGMVDGFSDALDAIAAED